MTDPTELSGKIVATRSGTRLSKSLMDSFIRQMDELSHCEKRRWKHVRPSCQPEPYPSWRIS
jgi:hypothetical protein